MRTFDLFMVSALIFTFYMLYKSKNIENFGIQSNNWKTSKYPTKYPFINNHRTMNNKITYKEKYCNPIVPITYPGDAKYKQNYFGFKDFVYLNSGVPDGVDKINNFVLGGSEKFKGQRISDIYDKLTSPDIPINISTSF